MVQSLQQDDASSASPSEPAGLSALKPGDPHYRAYVGPPLEYDLVGASQFRLLTTLGLRAGHRCLDLGCGSLRAGRLLIPYLDPGNYFGIVAGAEFAAPVLICGFHHSGTRLAADVMRRLGVFQRTNTPSQEWSYIQVLNTLLCPHWMDVGGIERFADGWDRSLIDPDRLAWRLAAAGFRGDGCWGHKDPRTCVTAEAWLDAFPGLRILNIVRDPRDVLGTLPERYARFSPGGARPQEDMPFWAGLWSAYLQRTRAAMRMAGASCEVRFEDLCADPVGTARRIRSELGLPRALDARRLRELAINPGKVGEHRNWLAQGTLTARQVSWLDRLAGDEGYERAST